VNGKNLPESALSKILPGGVTPLERTSIAFLEAHWGPGRGGFSDIKAYKTKLFWDFGPWDI